MTKRRIKEGVGEFPVDCPLEDCAVRVHYSARLAGSDEVSAALDACQCERCRKPPTNSLRDMHRPICRQKEE